MIPARMITALKAEIEEAVKDYRLQAEGQTEKKVTVYAQHIPDENFADDTYYPLVVASVQKVEDKEAGESVATVGLTIGVYGTDEAAWMDLLSIMERIRQHLLLHPLVDRRYGLQLPVEWETIESQPYPFWFGYGTLKYSVGQPIPEPYYRGMENEYGFRQS